MKQQYTSNIQNLVTWTPSTTYVLGFLCADGYLQSNNRTTSNDSFILGVNLKYSKNNLKILQYIRNVLHSTHPIKYYKNYNKLYQKYYYKYVFQIYGLSTEDVELLRSRSIFENKSKLEFLPKMPQDVIFDWLRGFFDGDGFITIFKRKDRSNSHIRCLGFCSGGIKILQQIQTKICFNYGHIYRRKKNLYKLEIKQKTHIKHVAQLMYKNDLCSVLYKKQKFIADNLI